MGSIWAWIKHHPEFLILIAVLIVGQALQKVLLPLVEEPYSSGEFPLLPTLVLAVMLVLAAVVVWLRVRLGGQLHSAGARLSLPAPESLPARYRLAEPTPRAISGALSLLDIALVLLVAATLRAPVRALAGHYVSPVWAEVGFVVLVLLAALLVLSTLFRTGGPVLVLLLWSGLDRVVPTAGFVSTGPMPVPTRPRTLTLTPPPSEAVAAPHTQEAELEPTVLAPLPPEADLEPTVMAPPPPEADGEATVRAPQPPEADGEATVVAPQPREADLEGPTVITRRDQ